jgi:hypothetical protein
MSEVATTVVSYIAAPRSRFFAWLVGGVFYSELETVLKDAAGLPGVAKTTDTTGPWDKAGSTRIVHLTDGNSVRETVTTATAPDYFAYRVTEFTTPLFRATCKEARGQWWFTDSGAGLEAKWTYTLESTSPLGLLVLYPVIKVLWHRYMQAAMQATKTRAEAEVGSVSGSAPSRPWNFDLVALHGPQETTDEDRAYEGSRYAEVRQALYANPYRDGKAGQAPGPLPMFQSTICNAWRGTICPPAPLKQASARTVDTHNDLRWGPDGKGYRRILAPNGICVLGTWEITVDNPYTGYFQKGSKGLTIGRISSDGNETKRGQRRSISLGMKIYPTTEPNHATPLIPASVIAQEDLGGMHTDYVNDAELMNKPSVHAYRRGIYVLIMLRAGSYFTQLDKVPDVRLLFEVAELGKPRDVPTRCPEHMLLKMTPGQRRIEGAGLDFRDEVYAHIYRSSNDPEPTGAMEYDIFVSDNDRSIGFPGFKKVVVCDWQKIGTLRFTEAICSYNADHVIHFHHPGWRDDKNDPRTAIRVDEQRVR